MWKWGGGKYVFQREGGSRQKKSQGQVPEVVGGCVLRLARRQCGGSCRNRQLGHLGPYGPGARMCGGQ